MSKQYEPFGEALVSNECLTREDEAARLPSLRMGVAAFWLIAMAMVFARAAYFDPTSSQMLSAIGAWFGHIRSLTIG